MTPRGTTFLFTNGAVTLPAPSLVSYSYSDARMLNVVRGDTCSAAHLDPTLPSIADTNRTDVKRETSDDL
jgi:hypothetical protein